MSVWSFYSPESLELVGRTFAGPVEALEANTPPGCAAVEGEHDHLCHRIEMVTDDFGDQRPVVVDWQPPAPTADDWTTWSWSEDARRWLPVPTLAARKRDRVILVQAAIEQHETRQARPVRALLAAQLSGTPPAADDVAALTSINAAIDVLRAVRAAMEAAPDQEALDAITWQPS